jgi:hypothetical protein
MARDEAWTDERLDDLNKRVDDGFSEMREEFRSVRLEMREEFRSVRLEMREEFRAMRGGMIQQFATQNRMIVIGFLGVIATIFAHG